MVEQVKDLGAETKILALADLEDPAEGEVDIRLGPMMQLREESP
jgi:hypothetical protein